MKKLSREEMKGVMGGYPQPSTGCYMKCCFTPLVNGVCHTGHVAQVPVEGCVGAGDANCGGGFFMSCWCFGGPSF